MRIRVRGSLVQTGLWGAAFALSAAAMWAQQPGGSRYSDLRPPHLRTWEEWTHSGDGVTRNVRHGTSLGSSPVGQSYIYDPDYSYRYSPESAHRAADRVRYERHAYSRGPTQQHHDTSGRYQVWDGMDGALASQAQHMYALPLGAHPGDFGLKDAPLDYRGYMPVYDNLDASRMILRVYRTRTVEPAAGEKSGEQTLSGDLLQLVTASPWRENSMPGTAETRLQGGAGSGALDKSAAGGDSMAAKSKSSNAVALGPGIVSVSSMQPAVSGAILPPANASTGAMPRTQLFILRRPANDPSAPPELIRVD